MGIATDGIGSTSSSRSHKDRRENQPVKSAKRSRASFHECLVGLCCSILSTMVCKGPTGRTCSTYDLFIGVDAVGCAAPGRRGVRKELRLRRHKQWLRAWQLLRRAIEAIQNVADAIDWTHSCGSARLPGRAPGIATLYPTFHSHDLRKTLVPIITHEQFQHFAAVALPMCGVATQTALVLLGSTWACAQCTSKLPVGK